MMLHPGVASLFVGSLVVGFMVVYACCHAAKILRLWNLGSGSEVQLNLERKTYLVSTLMSYAFVFQLLSLFLFIFTADKLSTLFVGAMCAAGTLNVNSYGYPAIVLKIVNFIFGGTWLILNYVDNRTIDYRLIRKKYLFLLVIAPFVIADTVLQSAYFLNLKPDVITSCCASLFGADGRSGMGASISILPATPMKAVFYGTMAITLVTGGHFHVTGKAGLVFPVASLVTFAVSAASLISFISPYFYELPTHHCPFCLLQREYGYVGYPLYATLLGGVLGGAAEGALVAANRGGDLNEAVVRMQKRLTLMTLRSYLLFTVIVSSAMIFTDFRPAGV